MLLPKLPLLQLDGASPGKAEWFEPYADNLNATWKWMKLLQQTGPSCYSIFGNSSVISNSAAQTAFDRSVTIPANLLQKGAVIRVSFSAFAVSNVAGSTFSMLLQVGGTPVAGFMTTGNLVSATNWIFAVPPFDMRVGATGATGNCYNPQCSGFVLDTGGVLKSGPLYATGGASAFPLNTTIPNVVRVVEQMGTANAANQTFLSTLNVTIFQPDQTF